MKTKIIKIGNSRGLRIPKGILEEVGLEDEVLLEASKNSLVIRPTTAPRDGWEEAFRKMAERHDDALLDTDRTLPTTWDNTEWKW